MDYDTERFFIGAVVATIAGIAVWMIFIHAVLSI